MRHWRIEGGSKIARHSCHQESDDLVAAKEVARTTQIWFNFTSSRPDPDSEQECVRGTLEGHEAATCSSWERFVSDGFEDLLVSYHHLSISALSVFAVSVGHLRRPYQLSKASPVSRDELSSDQV
jgi:hypothetical protein